MSMKLGKRFLGAMVVTALVTMSLSFNAFAKSTGTYSMEYQASVTAVDDDNMANHIYYVNDGSKEGTQYNGYTYNTTIRWPKSNKSVHGYYLAIQDANNTKRWLVKGTATTNPNVTADDVYGLPVGTYNIYVYPIDRNYKLVVEFYGMRAKIHSYLYMYNAIELPIQ